MKRFIAMVLTCVFALEPALFAGLGSDKTAYVGGTENQIKEGTEGTSSAKDDKNFMFEWKGGSLANPIDSFRPVAAGRSESADR